MRRLPAIILFLWLATATTRGRAQSYFTKSEVGISFGGSQYFGDLNDRYGFKTIGLAGGLYARRKLSNYIAIKLGAYYTKVGYDDKYNADGYERQRNLNFKSDIIEVSFQAEFNFFRFITGDPHYRFTPYLTGGIGGFYYNPYTTYNGVKYYLRPLGTEGQFIGHADRKYTTYSECFPIGVGFKFWIIGGVNLSLEIADRLTRTDYIDDVSTTYVGAGSFPIVAGAPPAGQLQDRSVELDAGNPLGRAGKQRGNTSTFDQYLMAMFSISWHFTTYRCPQNTDGDMIRTY
jgi:hypothetical protein